MTVYMVDRDLPWITLGQLARPQRAVIETCKQFTANGHPVRYIRSTCVPGDSHCMCLFEAADPDLVKNVNDKAKIPYTRVTEALNLTP